jgi:hypothetical protein
MTTEDEKLKFTLDEDLDDSDDYRPSYGGSTPVNNGSQAELSIALKKLNELTERQKQLEEKDKLYNAKEAFMKFENDFSDIEPQIKNYIKTHIKFAQDAQQFAMEEKQKKIDALEKQIAENEAEIKNAFSYLSNLDFRTSTNELSKYALDLAAEEVDFDNAHTKSGAWKKDYVDFVKREYTLRTTNDEKFKQKVLSVANDPALKPEKREKKLAELMSEAAIDAFKLKNKSKPRSQKATIDEVVKDSKKEAEKLEKQKEILEESKDETPKGPTKEQIDKANAQALKALGRF